MPSADICIAGAGLIGLSLALELHHRGARVTVLEQDTALSHTSIAAAGMLAANDPENPTLLQPLSAHSVALYPEFLARIASLSGIAVPFHTSRTFQAHSSFTSTFDPKLLPQLTPGKHHFAALAEHSLDPRQLAAALLAAVHNTPIELREHTSLHTAVSSSNGVRLETSTGPIEATHLIHTRGAWSDAPVKPRKGQMLVVTLPSPLTLKDVIRTPDIYIVPRTIGPRAGHVLIGATVEDAGFDKTVHPADLSRLRKLAAELLPLLGDETLCPIVDSWAGLRPATPDILPILGPLPGAPNQFVTTGHFRNGILLASGTARVMAELLSGEPTSVDLSPFSAERFP